MLKLSAPTVPVNFTEANPLQLQCYRLQLVREAPTSAPSTEKVPAMAPLVSVPGNLPGW